MKIQVYILISVISIVSASSYYDPLSDFISREPLPPKAENDITPSLTETQLANLFNNNNIPSLVDITNSVTPSPADINTNTPILSQTGQTLQQYLDSLPPQPGTMSTPISLSGETISFNDTNSRQGSTKQQRYVKTSESDPYNHSPNRWVASVIFTMSSHSYRCSGSMISDFVLLTAGHCVYQRGVGWNDPASFIVILSSTDQHPISTTDAWDIQDLDKILGVAHGVQTFVASNYISASEDDQWSYDYGLVVLDRPIGIRSGKYQRDYANTKIPTGSGAYLQQWGYPGVNYDGTRQYYTNGYTTSATSMVESDNLYVCQGDSGSARYVTASNLYYAVAVTSFNVGCGSGGCCVASSGGPILTADRNNGIDSGISTYATYPPKYSDVGEYLFYAAGSEAAHKYINSYNCANNKYTTACKFKTHFELVNTGFNNSGSITVYFYYSTTQDSSTATYLSYATYGGLGAWSYAGFDAYLRLQSTGFYYIWAYPVQYYKHYSNTFAEKVIYLGGIQVTSASWVVGSWSLCQSNCYKTRTVSCKDNSGNVLGDGCCNAINKPATSATCSVGTNYCCTTGCYQCTGVGLSKTVCSKCNEAIGYRLDLGGSNCVSNCAPKQFNNISLANDQCQSCSTGCYNCTTIGLDINNCQRCDEANGYRLNSAGTACVNSCPYGYYNNKNLEKDQCVPCQTGCARCTGYGLSSSVCVACDENNLWLWNPAKTSCVSSCSRGYTPQRNADQCVPV